MNPETKHTPPFTIGYIEDTPGEKFITIGSHCSHTLFARIPYVDQEQCQTLCDILNAANSHDSLVAALQKARDELDRLSEVVGEQDHASIVDVLADIDAVLSAAGSGT